MCDDAAMWRSDTTSTIYRSVVEPPPGYPRQSAKLVGEVLNENFFVSLKLFALLGNFFKIIRIAPLKLENFLAPSLLYRLL